jgi:hypothetical protein
MDENGQRHDATWNLHPDGQRKLRGRDVFALRVGDGSQRSYGFSYGQHLPDWTSQFRLQSHDERTLWRHRRSVRLAPAVVILR